MSTDTPPAAACAARLDRLEARLAQLENDSGDVAHMIMGDLAGVRADLIALQTGLQEATRSQAEPSRPPSGLVWLMLVGVFSALGAGLAMSVLQ